MPKKFARAPIGSKINQCHFGALRFFVTRHPKYAPNFGAGQKNNQCHGTVALARWAPLNILDTFPHYTRTNCSNDYWIWSLLIAP